MVVQHDQRSARLRRPEHPISQLRVWCIIDDGSQYTSIALTTALVEAGIAPSIGTVGDAPDNALMESTIGLYKTELIELQRRTWTGPAEVETETASWVHWFNTDRLSQGVPRPLRVVA